MKLLRLREVPQRGSEPVFRNASWRGLAMVVLVMAGITGYVAIPKLAPTPPALVAVPGFVTVLFLVLLCMRVALCLRRENWLLRIAPDGLYIHLRSFINRRLPENSPTVLFLAKEEIAGVCVRREDRYLPARYGGTSHDRFSYVDLVVRFQHGQADQDIVAQTLRCERRVPGIQHLDFPVRLVPPKQPGDPTLVRLVWDQIRPNESAAAKVLGRQFDRFPDARYTEAPWDKLDSAGKEAFIAELWEMGHVQDAELLVRLKHKVGKRGVEEYFKVRFGDS